MHRLTTASQTASQVRSMPEHQNVLQIPLGLAKMVNHLFRWRESVLWMEWHLSHNRRR